MHAMGIKCILCGEKFQTLGDSSPRVLPCLHAVCLECLSESSSSSAPGGIISCPACGFKCNNLKKVPPLFFDKDTNGLGASKGAVATDSQNGVDDLCSPRGEAASEDDDNSSTLSSLSDFSDEPHQVNGCKCQQDLEHGRKVEYQSDDHYDFYCTTCDFAVCSVCRNGPHSEHICVQLSLMLKNKKEYVHELLKQVDEKIAKSKAKVTQIGVVTEHLVTMKSELQNEIGERADHLITMIMDRKEALLAELDRVYASKSNEYCSEAENQSSRIKIYNDSYEFAQKVISQGTDTDLLNFQNDITNRLLHLIHQMKEASLEITNLKVDIPERGKEESHLEKLFGSLVQGNVSCGDAELLMSFNIDLKWPTSLVIYKSQSIIVTGKTGAFDSQGRLLFYDKQGNLHSGHEFEDRCIPNDVVCGSDGTILVSDNMGRISKITPQGKVYQVMEDKFKGTSGRLAMTNDNHIVVTSMDDKCIFQYDLSGRKTSVIPSSSCISDFPQLQPSCIAVNSNNDIVVADQNDSTILVFDSSGDFKLRCGQEKFNNNLKCPSSICCDPFNNILVADFTNDAVLLLSSKGEFLGSLVTKDNGISCPNFISLDHEGHLFVGQYGGDILVFRYLSCIKHA